MLKAWNPKPLDIHWIGKMGWGENFKSLKA